MEKKKNILIGLLLVLLVLAAIYIGLDQLKHKRELQVSQLILQYKFSNSEEQKKALVTEIRRIETGSPSKSASADDIDDWLIHCQQLYEQADDYSDQGEQETALYIHSDARAARCPWTW
jgi:hypothetical protein